MEEPQSTTVEITPEGPILIHYDWNPNGLKMGGDFVIESANVEWLADQLILAANEDIYREVTVEAPPDHLTVYIGGGQRYDDINVNVHNKREEQAPYGKLFVLIAMTREIATNLADQLRRLRYSV